MIEVLVTNLHYSNTVRSSSDAIVRSANLQGTMWMHAHHQKPLRSAASGWITNELKAHYLLAHHKSS